MVRNAMLKKLAVTAVIAFGAVALPAAAQAEEWDVNGTALPASPAAAHTPIEASGTWTVHRAGGFTETCDVAIEGEIWNDDDGMGHSLFTSFVTSPTPCPTNYPPCMLTLHALTSVPSPSPPWVTSLPWPGDLAYDGLLVRNSISDVMLVGSYSGTCPGGIPTGVPYSEGGTLHPIVDTGGRLTFDGGAQNTMTGPRGNSTVTGSVTITSPSGVSAS